ncbi:MAG: LLM class flavin-dependent oxidoreductase [Alphaproteobacteria bacterium]|nr:LLM class flavin-dependent oxidoreductase [Alphaproteobacteria bacterium]
MQFGAMVNTKIDEWQTLKLAEELGYDSGWAPDSQMIWSDCYAVLALAAANTSRIRLGTGVAIPGTRLAPVTAHSIASVNRLPPRRRLPRRSRRPPRRPHLGQKADEARRLSGLSARGARPAAWRGGGVHP